MPPLSGFSLSRGCRLDRVAGRRSMGFPPSSRPFEPRRSSRRSRASSAFIAHGGAVYQIITYSTLGVFANYEQAFQQTISSFAPLTDPQALNVQPARMRVVRTTETMTLVQFNQRFPSSIPINELVILNQLTGPDSPIPAGTMIKRIVAG
jgi:predicted Zn-dependent protease